MIPAFLIARFGPTVAKLIFWGSVAVFLVIALSVARCVSNQGIETQNKVNKGQAGAAQQSGHDAVQSISNVMANDQATNDITQENRNAIEHAKGADTAVDPAVRTIGVQSLCRRPSYRRDHPECVQQPAPR